MSITPEQREARRRYLGSSDAASIFNVTPYMRPIDVWRAKVQGADKEETDRMREGTLLEPSILSWAEWKLGVPLVRSEMKVHANGVMSANFDGINHDEKFIVECKWRPSQDRHEEHEKYGRANSDQVPVSVRIQVMHALAVAGPEYHTAYVAVLRGWDGLGFGMYRLRRDAEDIENIERVLVNFWNDYVLTKTPPPEIAQ